jgi:hypothetical protein
MLKLHCIFDASVLPDVIKLVEKKAHELNSKKKSAKVEDVYRELRDDGFEIDGESVAFAYQQVSGIMGRKGFSTQADVKKFGGEGMRKAIRLANEGDIVKSRLGKTSLNTSIASGIAKTFSALEGKNDIDRSRLFELQSALRRAASSMLNKKGYNAAPKDSFQDVLKSLFDLENITATGTDAMKNRVKGTMNTIEEVWDAVSADIATVAAGIKDKAARARFEEMTAEIRKSSYDLLLGTRQADDVIKGILKEAGYVKSVTINGNQTDVVDWNKALSEQAEWKTTFTRVLRGGGFDATQTSRIINKLEGNYTRALEKQAENVLNKINKKNNINAEVNKGAIHRMIRMRNAGIFAPNNKNYLKAAMGIDMPQEVADEVAQIVRDHEQNIKRTGDLSLVQSEEVINALRRAMAGLGDKGAEKVINAVNDYMSLSNASIISSGFNFIQNAGSGLFASFTTAVTILAKTRNPKLLAHFTRNWLNTFADVAAGGVTIRDSKTINALDSLQGRGGLSDRWVFDGSEGWWGKTKAFLQVIPQITATATDAANKSLIYQSEMIQDARRVIRAKNPGMSRSKVNNAIDDIIFGTDPVTNKTNRQLWKEEAMKRLENQEGVVARGAKASRIADELVWHKLTSKYGIPFQLIKSMQSASVRQAGINLGHEADIPFAPSWFIQAALNEVGRRATVAKNAGNRSGFLFWTVFGMLSRQANVFIGGQANWAILNLESTPIGLALGITDVLWQEATALGSNTLPEYRQKLSLDDAQEMEEQLKARKQIQGRLERGITGTFVQTLLVWGIVAMLGDGEDEDRNEVIADVFGDALKDPNLRRFIDKAMPQMLAAELAFAFDKKTNKIDENKISKFWSLPQYIHPDNVLEHAWASIGTKGLVENINKDMEYAKTPEEKGEAFWRNIGGIFKIPYTVWFDIEKGEAKVFENGFQPDEAERMRRKREFKQKIQSIDGKVDAFSTGVGMPWLVDFFKGE